MVFQQEPSNIRIHSVEPNSFTLSVRALDPEAPEPGILHQCHHTVNAILIALNVGSLGMFYWANEPWAHPILTISDDMEGRVNSRGRALITRTPTPYPHPEELPESAVYAAALIFGIIAKESSDVLVGEYCRGLLLLRMNFHQLNFRREAFLCFYRALENFAARRILGVKRLQNEVKDIQRALRTITNDGVLVEGFRSVYIARSGQVAHSQNDQEDVPLNDVLKAKAFLDLVVHKTFKQKANDLMIEKFDVRPEVKE